MKYGMFAMPLRPPGGDVTKEYHQDIETFVMGDKLGYTEGWMGEHYTIPWEPIPATDLFAASVFARTKNIRIGTGIVLLPMHDPRQVALRIAYLDHLSEGRLNFGIGAGGARARPGRPGASPAAGGGDGAATSVPVGGTSKGSSGSSVR